MLLNFSLRNYRSFAGPLQFSMMRGKHDISDDDRWPKPNVSAVSAVYGPNASGKSNFLKALHFVSTFVLRGDRFGDAFDEIRGFEPFLLDQSLASGQADFLIEFIASDGTRYEYSFSITAREVIDEELVAFYSRQPTRLYVRSTDSDGKQVIQFGPSLKGAKQQLWSITRGNTLFLSAAGGSGKIDSLKVPYLELTREMTVLSHAGGGRLPRGVALSLASFKQRSPLAFERLVELVRHADFGIDGIEVRRKEDSDEASGYDIASGERLTPRRDDSQVFFLHRGAEGTVALTSAYESEGTLSALSFFSRALKVLEHGGVLLVDELDMSLHPTLVREFVSLFAEPDTNPRQAQLIFTTHDVSLISVPSNERRILARDQVWFCEKDAAGRSEIFPATSYSPRAGENLGRNYLNGIYGALPNLTIHEEVAEMMDMENGVSDE